MLVDKSSQQISTDQNILDLEKTLLKLPQVECPVIHRFGPGIYIREVHMPSGTLAVGHSQKFEHLNILLKGKVAMVIDGKLQIFQAPLIYTGKPGKKFGYILEDTVWQNVYATSETDVEKLEAYFLDKSQEWEDHYEKINTLWSILRADDRRDYIKFVNQLNTTDSEIRKQSEEDLDQIKMPEPYSSYVTVRDSQIEGKGLFSTVPLVSGDIIAPARLNNMRTPAGRFTNHSKYPNAEFRQLGNGDIYLVTIQSINGCISGNYGEEITVNYRQALSLSNIFLEG